MTYENEVKARYGEGNLPSLHMLNETTAMLLRHRSVRAYRDEPLPAGTLETLVAAAQSAATSSNLQAWSVVAVEEPEHKRHVAVLAGDQGQVHECPLFLVWLADLARLERVADQRGIAHDGLDYLEMFIVAAVDATLAAQNAVVAAESLGLGTVYIGAVRNKPLDMAAALRLPPRVFPLFGVCIGWPDEARPASVKPRLPQRAVLHRDYYDADVQDEAVADYQATMEAFYQSETMGGTHDWTQRSARRVSGPGSLSGRDTIRESLHQLGFDLL